MINHWNCELFLTRVDWTQEIVGFSEDHYTLAPRGIQSGVPRPSSTGDLINLPLWRALALITVLTGCGSIERSASTQQTLGRALLAGHGDVVLRIDRERSLTNVVGKADIWGRKTNEGFSEVRFAGVEPNGEVVLYRRAVQVMSNETTLTRTPMSFQSGSANATMSGTAATSGGTTQFSGTSRSVGSPTTISSGSAYHIAMPSDTIAIRLGPSERRVPISGYLVEILSASPNSIEYRITVQPQ